MCRFESEIDSVRATCNYVDSPFKFGKEYQGGGEVEGV